MTGAIPPIQVKVEADTTGLKTGLDQAKAGIKQVDDSVKTANTGMKSFTDNLKKVGAAMGVAFAGAQIVQFGKDVILASSSMAESLSKVNVVFGEGAASVIDFGNKAATSLGISNQKALEAAGTYGNLFQALGVGRGAAQEMSTTLVQLAADLASFNNTSIDDALNALRSGLSGETEPLKRFGVALNDVTLKAKAFEMGFGNIKGVMDPAIKAQVTYALVMEQTSLAQGDYARTADGTANTMKTLTAQFQDAKVALGDALMPAFRALLSLLKIVIPVLKSIGDFFKENYTALKMYGTIVLTATGLLYGYKAAVIAVTTAKKVAMAVTAAYTAVMKAHAAGHTFAAIAALNFRGAMMMLNMAIRANPIGALITVLTVLGAAFVAAWKKSETFRGVVIKVAQAVATAFAKVIEILGKFFGLLGKVPGMGWAKSIGKGLDEVSSKIVTTSKNLSDLKSNFKGMGNITMTPGGIGGTTGGTGSGSGSTGSSTDAKNKEKLEKYAKDVKEIYKDINEAIISAKEKAAEALANRDEKIAEATERALEQEADLRKNYANKMAEAQKSYNEAIANAYENYNEAVEDAHKDHQDAIYNADKDYAKRTLDLTKDLTKKIADLRENANKKSVDATKAAAEKQESIVKQSVDRLRTAFASKTGFDLSEAFKGNQSIDKVLGDLKAKLEGAKNLQKNAAALAGLGYSQTFIEEVVKNGPEAGNQIAEALKAASPEATKELQELYSQVDFVSEHGLDDLAKTMNAGANLATQELKDAYSQVAIDLQQSLTTINTELQENLAEANIQYLDAMAEAKTLRDEKIQDAEIRLQESLEKAHRQLTKSILAATQALRERQIEAQKYLDEGLEEIQKSLQKALLDAQKDYLKAIDEINKDTQKKVDELKAKLLEVSALMRAISAVSAGGVVINAPKYSPIIPATSPAVPQTNNNNQTPLVVNNNITAVKVNPTDVSNATLSAIKYGSALTIA